MQLKSTRLKNTLIRLVFSMVPRESKLLPYACFIASSLVTRSSISCAMPLSWMAVRICLRAVTKYMSSLRGNVGGELLCARGCRCEFTMHGIVDVEQWNGQLEHELVKLPRAPH